MKKKLNFTHKIFLGNIVIIIVFSLIILVSFSRFFLKTESEKAAQTLKNLTENISTQMDSILYNADNLALQVCNAPTTVDLFQSLSENKSKNNIFIEDSFLRKNTADFLTSYNFKDSLDTRISLYSSPHHVSYGYAPTDEAAIKKFFSLEAYQSIVKYFENPEHYRLFIPPQADSFALDSPYIEEDTLFSIVRTIKNLRIPDAPIQGYVEVQLPYSRLSDLFTNLHPSIHGYIVDSENQIIYPSENSSKTFDELNISKHKFLSYRQPLKEEKYSIILIQDRNYIFSNYKAILIIVLLIVICFLIFTCILQYLLIHHFTKPLTQLHHSIKQVSLDHFKLDMTSTNNDMISELNTAFSKMLKHLENSINESIIAKTSEAESHFLALQAQINPHFLHNILTIISTIASENNVPQIETMCEKLASMLRFSTSYKQTTCSLSDEIDYLKNYLDLMKDRYEDCLLYELEIDDNYRHINVPKFFIQPLVENSFQHGLKTVPFPWTVKVHAYTSNDYWYVDITDNGCGFSESSISDFYTKISSLNGSDTGKEFTKLEIGGLGLVNIYFRMKYYYSNDMIFKLSNASNGGANIRIGGKINAKSISCRR